MGSLERREPNVNVDFGGKEGTHGCVPLKGESPEEGSLGY